MEYSVLMSVYAKEEPVYLDTAIQSMLDQTVRTDDFVIVCDGPLTAELDAVLERHLAQNPALIHRTAMTLWGMKPALPIM